MKRNVLVVVVAVMLLSVTGAWAQDSIIDNVMKACETEINTYCSQVTLGEGRLLACFYAHEDKISGRCQYALYEGARAARTVCRCGHPRRDGVPRRPDELLRPGRARRGSGWDLPAGAQGRGHGRVQTGDRRRRARGRRRLTRTSNRVVSVRVSLPECQVCARRSQGKVRKFRCHDISVPGETSLTLLTCPVPRPFFVSREEPEKVNNVSPGTDASLSSGGLLLRQRNKRHRHREVEDEGL